MSRTFAALGTCVGLVMLVTTPVDAQLTPGTWTGTMSPPGNQSVGVSYEVAETDGALSIVMSASEVGMSFPLNDVSLDGDTLTFWWAPGDRVECTLLQQENGSFEGTCTDGGANGEGTLTMRPPSAPGHS